MNSNLTGQIILQAVLIAMNAIFACAEIAVISMSGNRLDKLAGDGDKRALRLARLTNQPARFLATIQVAITLSGFLGSAFAADNFSDMLVTAIMKLNLPVSEKTLRYYFGSIDYNNIIIFHTCVWRTCSQTFGDAKI